MFFFPFQNYFTLNHLASSHQLTFVSHATDAMAGKQNASECKIIQLACLQLDSLSCPWLIFVTLNEKDVVPLMEILKIVSISAGESRTFSKPFRIYKPKYKVLNYK